jgi:uroporphyrinogen-III synthase
VVVTREEGAGGPLSAALRQHGFSPVQRPVLHTRSLVDAAVLERFRSAVEEHTWLLVTSPRTVRVLGDAGFFLHGRPGHLRVGAAGTATAAALRQAGWAADLVPDAAGAAGLLQGLSSGAAGSAHAPSALIPGSARSLPELPLGLEERGWRVTTLPVYDVVPADAPDPWWTGLEPSPELVLTFCSPSAVAGVDAAREHRAPDPLRVETLVGVQGPTTARAARDAGWRRVVEAHPRTFAGLAAELARHTVHTARSGAL